MRSLKKNQQKLWYSLFDKAVPEYETDEDGNIVYVEIDGEKVPIETGNTKAGYSSPVFFHANISAGKGTAQTEVFGKEIDFTRTISSTDMSLPIDENSLIWYETEPKMNADGTADPDSADYAVAAPPAKGLNSVMIAIKKRQKNQRV